MIKQLPTNILVIRMIMQLGSLFSSYMCISRYARPRIALEIAQRLMPPFLESVDDPFASSYSRF
jgi:hypothetical protein